ncbi:DUF1249 domain-containing protein [Undibacterium sp. Ji67W]|uniref:DUF1249 domain-containing protein n=1 Tax=Undibacterium sp. Ji67W TaxID=3413042 RepID=UPI003BF33C7E
MAQEALHEQIYTDIYQRLLAVAPCLLAINSHGKSEVVGMMSLNLDILTRTPSKLIIALSHYYKHPSGDMIPDPDMMIEVFPDKNVAEALTYQDAYIITEVYGDGGCLIDNTERRSLNEFLHTWLGNLIEQGHSIRLT